MSLPSYCLDTLFCVINLLNNTISSTRPLKVIKEVAYVIYELINLLISSITPTIWFCNNPTSIKISQSIKTLFNYLSEILNYYEQFISTDYFRITYLFFLNVTIKFISHLVPLEVCDQILPKSMKLCICNTLMDGSLFLLYPSLHETLNEYAKVRINFNEIFVENK